MVIELPAAGNPLVLKRNQPTSNGAMRKPPEIAEAIAQKRNSGNPGNSRRFCGKIGVSWGRSAWEHTHFVPWLRIYAHPAMGLPENTLLSLASSSAPGRPPIPASPTATPTAARYSASCSLRRTKPTNREQAPSSASPVAIAAAAAEEGDMTAYRQRSRAMNVDGGAAGDVINLPPAAGGLDQAAELAG